MRLAVRGLHRGPGIDGSTLQCARPGQSELNSVVWFEYPPFGLADLLVATSKALRKRFMLQQGKSGHVGNPWFLFVDGKLFQQ